MLLSLRSHEDEVYVLSQEISFYVLVPYYLLQGVTISVTKVLVYHHIDSFIQLAKH
jgi:riboflavin transporter FmnP